MSLNRKPNCASCSKELSEVEEIVKCFRCKTLSYCSSRCCKNDASSHKKICQKFGFLKNLIPKIEKNFYDFNLVSVPPLGAEQNPQMMEILRMMREMNRADPNARVKEGRQNVFETMVGEFSEMNDRNMHVKGHNNPDKMWPRDYLVRRMRYVESMWEMACQTNDHVLTEKALDELLEMIRLDFGDFCMAVPMAGFMFLYLGRTQDAYDFMCFWMEHCEEKFGQDFTEVCEVGGFFSENDEWMFENFFKKFEIKGTNLKYLLVLLAIKMKCVAHLKNVKAYYAFEEQLKKSKCESAKKLYEEEDSLDMVYEYVCGFEYFEKKSVGKMLRDQFSQIIGILREIDTQNPTMLKALLNPEPLLSKGIPVNIVIGDVGQAAEALRYSWKYFADLPGARKIIQDYLYPNGLPRGGLPAYKTAFCTKYDTLEDTTGFDRFYVTHMGKGCPMLTRPEEFKRDAEPSRFS